MYEEGPAQVRVAVNGSVFATLTTFNASSASDYSAYIDSQEIYMKDLPVVIVDINYPPSSLSPSHFYVTEEVSVGTHDNMVLGRLVAQDEDPIDTHTFHLLATYPPTVYAFYIDPTTGDLHTNGSFSFRYNSQSSYVLLIRVNDSGIPSIGLDVNVTIDVVDIPEMPSELALSCYDPRGRGRQCYVPVHSSTVGSNVGTFTAIDPDTIGAHTYRLVKATYQDAHMSVDVDVGSLEAMLNVSTGGALYISATPPLISRPVVLRLLVSTVDAVLGVSVNASFDVTIYPISLLPVLTTVVCYCDEDRPVGDEVWSTTHSNPNGTGAVLVSMDIPFFSFIYSLVLPSIPFHSLLLPYTPLYCPCKLTHPPLYAIPQAPPLV